MGSLSVSFGLPFCHKLKGEESKYSKVLTGTAKGLGVTTLCVGIIAGLIGFLLLMHIVELQGFGTTSAWLLTVSGSFSSSVGLGLAFIGFCIKCTKNEYDAWNPNKTPKRIIDPRASGVHHTYSSYTDEDISYVSMSDFFSSQDPQNVAILRELRSMYPKNLESLLLENYGTTKVEISIPIIIKGIDCGKRVRDEDCLMEFLKLIFSPKEELLALEVKKIGKMSPDMQNLLVLRLSSYQNLPPNEVSDETLGSFLTLQVEEICHQEPGLFFLFTEAQVNCFLENTPVVSKEIVEALFPNDKLLFFINGRSQYLLKHLPVEGVNNCLAFLRPSQIFDLMLLRKEVDFTLLKKDQVQDMFPVYFMGEPKTVAKFERLEIGVLNQIIPKMSAGQLRRLPAKHLKNEKLNLEALTSEQVQDMCSLSFDSKERTISNLKALKIGVLNQIIPKMSGGQLNRLPAKHLKNEKLNLEALTSEQVLDMCSLSFDSKERTINNLKTLKIGVLNQIIPKMSGGQLSHLPAKHLQNEKLDLQTLTPEQVRGMFSARFEVALESEKRLKMLKPSVLAQISSKLSREQKTWLPQLILNKIVNS